MAGTSDTSRTSAGDIACIDYGGSGVPEVLGYVVDRFRLGVRATTESQRDDLVDELVAAAENDWMQAAQHRDVVRASAERSFVPEDGAWVRQPPLPTTRNISATHPQQVASAIRDLLEFTELVG